MSMINVMFKSDDHECPVKLEDLPSMFIASKNGVPCRWFWSDMVAVLAESDLNKLMVPNSDFMKNVVVTHNGEQWKVEEPVVFNKSPSPIGNLIVVLLRAEKYEYLNKQ